MGKQDDFFRTQIRIPAEIHRALKDATEDSGRSMNAEIVARLEQSFAAQGSGHMDPESADFISRKFEELRQELDAFKVAHEEAKEFIREIREMDGEKGKGADKSP